jgi:MFS family permease
MVEPSPSPPPSPVEAPYASVTEQPSLRGVDQSSLSRWVVPRAAVIVVAAVLVVLCSGGLVLGFGPMYTLLVDEGQWSELCAPGEEISGVTCASQEVKLQYIYSTAFLCLSAANVASGVSLDVIGARLTVCLGLVISIVGNVLLALGQSTDGDGVSIIAGYSLIGVGGYGLYISSFQLVLLFPPEQQGRITSILSGLFNFSGYVFLLLEVHGMTRRGFFLGYTVLVAACLVVAFVVFPVNSVSTTSETYTLSGLSMRCPVVTKPKSMWPALRSQLGRRDLWFFAVFFGWVSTINAFIGGAIPNIIYKNDGDDDSVGDLYVNYLQPLITNGTFLYTPLLGWVIDKYGCRVVFFVTLLATHVVIALLLVPSLTAQTFMLVLFAFEQSAFYTLQFAYIRESLGPRSVSSAFANVDSCCCVLRCSAHVPGRSLRLRAGLPGRVLLPAGAAQLRLHALGAERSRRRLPRGAAHHGGAGARHVLLHRAHPERQEPERGEGGRCRRRRARAGQALDPLGNVAHGIAPQLASSQVKLACGHPVRCTATRRRLPCRT